MESEQHSLAQLFYEQSVQHYNREADLLFRRFDFFLAAMSFLVAALVVVLTRDRIEYCLLNVVIVIGGMISAGFFVINCSNSKVLKAMRDYMYTVEKRLGVVAEQSVKLPGLKPPLTSAWPQLDPHRDKTRECALRTFFRDHPAVHTWLIPLLFTAFWTFVRFLF